MPTLPAFLAFVAALALPYSLGYPATVTETTVTGFGSPNYVSAQPRKAAFLCVSPSRASINGRALVGRASALPGAYVTGLPTSPCARPPHLEVGSGLTAYVRGRTMRHIPAHPEQIESPVLSIVRNALRAAALASSDRAALDVAGEALRRIAELVVVEVRHA
ncbi:hypothetical protein PHO31112_02903 [Pandoraea horticolens]|uniref:Uncharacterized protein n=2 Tax=Pandoraea horticolens TaxID=2508298 RepID=A0A5E4VVL3_9BURK|nr:hypothetical protein PHO31112_02903 [Pandoraea horticolens]